MKDLDAVMPMHNLVEYSDNYSKTSGSLYQFCRDDEKDPITDSGSFEFKSRPLNNTNNAGAVNVETIIPLKYLSNFWRTPAMPLNNCKISLILTWSTNCFISEGNRVRTFTIIDAKPYGLVVLLSSQDKLLQQLKSDFTRTTNYNKYQSKASTQIQNHYLDYLLVPSFQGVNRLFVLSFENNVVRIGHTEYFLLKVEVKD